MGDWPASHTFDNSRKDTHTVWVILKHIMSVNHWMVHYILPRGYFDDLRPQECTLIKKVFFILTRHGIKINVGYCWFILAKDWALGRSNFWPVYRLFRIDSKIRYQESIKRIRRENNWRETCSQKPFCRVQWSFLWKMRCRNRWSDKLFFHFYAIFLGLSGLHYLK